MNTKAFITIEENGNKVKVFYDEKSKHGFRWVKDENGRFIQRKINLSRDDYFKLRDLAVGKQEVAKPQDKPQPKVVAKPKEPAKLLPPDYKTITQNLPNERVKKEAWEKANIGYFEKLCNAQKIAVSGKIKEVVVNCIKNTPRIAKCSPDTLLNACVELYNQKLLEDNNVMIFPYDMDFQNPDKGFYERDYVAQIILKANAYTQLTNGMYNVRSFAKNQITTYKKDGTPVINNAIFNQGDDVELVEVSVKGHIGSVKCKAVKGGVLLPIVYDKESDTTKIYYTKEFLLKNFAMNYSDGYKQTLINNGGEVKNIGKDKWKTCLNDLWTNAPQIMLEKTAIKDAIRNTISMPVLDLDNEIKDGFEQASRIDQTVLKTIVDDHGQLLRDDKGKLIIDTIYIDNRASKGEIQLETYSLANNVIKEQANTQLDKAIAEEIAMEKALHDKKKAEASKPADEIEKGKFADDSDLPF